MAAVRVLLAFSAAIVIAVIGSSNARGASRADKVSGHIIYAANNFPATASITEYASDATGNVAPFAMIAGPDTGLLMGVAGLSVDSSGYLYAATSGVNGSPNAIVVYNPGANGDATPARTLTAQSHGGVWSAATAEDAAGDLWVANLSIPALEEFGPNANGDARPIRVISGANTGLIKPFGIAVSARGDIWVADLYAKKVMRFGPGQRGNVAPRQVISGAQTMLNDPSGVALSPGTVWVVDSSINPAGAVLAFAASSNGDIRPLRELRPFGPNVVNGGPVYFDGEVIFPGVSGGQASSVWVFPDDVSPSRSPQPNQIIAGSNTGLVSTGWVAAH